MALVISMSTSGLAGMGLSTQRWRQFRARGFFVGVFRDFRGPRAAFFVEEKTGLLLGPLDLDAPSGPGWSLAPGPEPRGLSVGEHVAVVYAGIVPSERPIGLPPGDDLSKQRVDRVTARGPLDGMFVSFEKLDGPAQIVTSDPLALALLGRAPALDDPESAEKAAVGFLLTRDRAHAREAIARLPKDHSLSALSALIFDGLGGFSEAPGALPRIAKLWRAGKKEQARAELVRDKAELHFWIRSDRWKRPPHPLESSPGAPLRGPFLRWDEYSGSETLALHYLAPDLLEFLAKELQWQEPPF